MIDLDALEALEKRATPGPWISNGIDIDQELTGYAVAYVWDKNGFPENKANAALIAAARNALPELIRLARIGQKVEEGK